MCVDAMDCEEMSEYRVQGTMYSVSGLSTCFYLWMTRMNPAYQRHRTLQCSD